MVGCWGHSGWYYCQPCIYFPRIRQRPNGEPTPSQFPGRRLGRCRSCRLSKGSRLKSTLPSPKNTRVYGGGKSSRQPSGKRSARWVRYKQNNYCMQVGVRASRQGLFFFSLDHPPSTSAVYLGLPALRLGRAMYFAQHGRSPSTAIALCTTPSRIWRCCKPWPRAGKRERYQPPMGYSEGM